MVILRTLRDEGLTENCLRFSFMERRCALSCLYNFLAQSKALKWVKLSHD